jgi:biotin operon repressor
VRNAQGGGAASLVLLLSGRVSRREIPPLSVWEERSRVAADKSQVSSSLVKGILLLAYLVSGEPTSIKDLAEELGMSPSTTHRYMHTLLILGLIEQDPKTRKYRLAA